MTMIHHKDYFMIKRSLLASSISLAALIVSQQASAAAFLPIDPRGLAMGSTGVASARLATAPQYNPALLSTANSDDDFAIVFPQFGVVVADEDEFVDTTKGLVDDDYKTTNESLLDHFRTIADNLQGSLGSLEDDISALSTTITNAGNLQSANAATLNQIRQSTTNLESGLSSFTSGTQDLKTTTFDLTSELDKLSESGLRANVGLTGALAIPSKTLGAAISLSGNVFASGRTIFTPEDQNLINAYADGVDEYSNLTKEFVSTTNELVRSIDAFNNDSSVANGQVVNANQAAVTAKQNELNSYTKQANGKNIISVNGGNVVVDEDPQLTSQAQVIAVSVVELGITLSHNFKIAGEDIAIGITPKFQTIKAFDYTGKVDDDDNEITEDDLKETEVNYNTVNLDAGIAYQFGGDKQWQVGFVAKNLISKEYDTENNLTTSALDNDTTFTLDTQFRGGISHTTDWTVIAIDVDLMENDPIAFESATQYAAIGAEFDLFDTLQFRTGFRTNLSTSDSDVVSLGIGLSPFGVHFDLAAIANTSDWKKEAGVAAQFGFYF